MRFSLLNSDAERREGLKALLRQIDRKARFNEAQDWRQADRILRRHQPDLLVIDWQDWMTVTDARALFTDHPHVPVAVLVDDTSPDCVRGLVETGALGVIPRSTDPRLIVRALELVLLGGHYIPAGALALDAPAAPAAAAAAPAAVPTAAPETRAETAGPGAVTATPSPAEGTPRRLELVVPTPARRTRFAGGLSPRQEQIMRCVHMGSTNKMIARALGISEGTVKIHLASIFQQLGAPNRAAAVAIYNGWLNAQLEVLRTSQESAERPVRGQPGIVPLRRRTRRKFKYPLPANDTATPLPMAAEPEVPFGDAAPAPTPPTPETCNDAATDAHSSTTGPQQESAPNDEAPDAPCDDWHGIRSHVSPPNE
ncbi:response regulator transcription factor [Paraburkholderia rhizosphaerae]|uniref:LuxR family two component transcriptional regulator n=1 Tax=Paraburkholderia rhizosphaerae TaxID=480658 RepID=A0A4R8L477_9BURK|nr:response regulator transcription factor [Paraburkholderia rhizosphaerae]TDY37303.1 LuxR family two component transcriptional regulator [Paraburkholderia rhizosphaerae]